MSDSLPAIGIFFGHLALRLPTTKSALSAAVAPIKSVAIVATMLTPIAIATESSRGWTLNLADEVHRLLARVVREGDVDIAVGIALHSGFLEEVLADYACNTGRREDRSCCRC